jgi:PAS domain S-box-containing protein
MSSGRAKRAAESSGSRRLTVDSDPRIVRRIRSLSRFAAAAATVGACTVLTGWVFGISSFQRLFPAAEPVKQTTAFLILLSAAALGVGGSPRGSALARERRLVGLLAYSVIAIASVALGRRLAEFAGKIRMASEPRSMAPMSAITLILFAISLLFLIQDGKRCVPISQGLALAVAIPLTVLLQYSLGSTHALEFLGHRPMAPGAALLLSVLGLGILNVWPERGLLAPLTAELPQSGLLRRLFTFSILSAVALGWLRLLLEKQGGVGEEGGDALQIGGTVAILALLVWWSARQFVELEQKRRSLAIESESRYRELFEHNVAGVFRSTLDGRMVECNAALAKIYGYDSVDDLKAAGTEALYASPEERDAFVALLRERGVLENLEFRSRRRDGSSVWTLENVAIVKRRGEEFLEGTMFEITDRKGAEDAVRRSEERYRRLFEENPLPMWIYHPATKQISDVNSAAIKVYGYSKSEFLTLSLHDLRPPEEFPRFRAQTERSYDVATNLGVWKHRKKDGALIDVEVTVLDFAGSGEPQRLALLHDVTDRLRAQQAVQLSEEKYRKLFDTSPESLILLTPEGLVIDVNPSGEELAGVPKERWIGRPFIERIAEGDVPAVEESLNLSRGGKAVGPFAVRLEGDGREAVAAELLVSPLFSGEVATNILAIGRNVSERTRAEEERQRLQKAIIDSAREWRETFDAIQSPILIVDDRGIIRRANRAVEEISHGSLLDLIGKPIDNFLESQPWRKAAALLRDMRGDALSAEGMCQDDQGGRYWEISVSQNSSASVSRVVVVIRDVSGTVALQKSLRRSETMSAMGSIVAGVAHEVRNPLFAISATVDAFELRFGKTEEFSRYAAALRSQLERMKNLVQDLFDYGKPSALQLTETNFSDIVARAISHCQTMARERQVEVRFSFGSTLPRLRADSDRLVRVLVNLIDNAVQHSNPGKSVYVVVDREEKSGAPALVCRVEDEGKGVALEDLPRLFEPFFSRRTGGTGLGLAIVKRIIEEHAGSIDAANRAETGAVFTFTLPLPALDPASAEDKAAS